MNVRELTGRERTHIVEVPQLKCQLHADVLAPFVALRRAALAEGMELAPVSAFRDFARQLAIWNGKFQGTRPLLDAAGQPLDGAAMAPAQRVDAILRWSALPGASRHHWGTDLDLIDRNAVPPGYVLELKPQEFADDGPFGAVARWLEANAPRFGFFQPYRGVRSGVQPEPWHFSFAPIAEPAREALTVEVLRATLEEAPLAGKPQVLERLEDLHRRYVAQIDWP